MQPMVHACVRSVALSILLFAIAGNACASRAFASSTAASAFDGRTDSDQMTVRQVSRAVLNLLNADRAAAHVEPLVRDHTLNIVATRHSTDMAMRHYFAHVTPDGSDPVDRFMHMGVRFDIAAENLGVASGYSWLRGVTVMNAEMMAEPLVEGSHHANIVDGSLHHVGIGVYLGLDNTIYLTEDFTN